MPGLTAVADLIRDIGVAAKISAAAVTEARSEVRSYVEEASAAQQVDAGMNKAGEDATDTKKLGAAVQALAGRVK